MTNVIASGSYSGSNGCACIIAIISSGSVTNLVNSSIVNAYMSSLS